jgi:GAF domain-containing protein
MASSRVTDILTAVVADVRSGKGLSESLVAMCARALPVGGAGLCLMTEDGPAGTVTATDGPARELEELQFALGEGPCVEASRTGRPVLEPDLARTGPPRWPAFAAGALDAGLRAVFAFPLRVGGIRVGVLDLYRDAPGVLGPAHFAEALAFADAATALLLRLQVQGRDTALPLDSLPVLDDRARVHQATGVVSVQAGVSLREALLLLRARAYADQRPIGDLARDVVDGAVRFGRMEESP